MFLRATQCSPCEKPGKRIERVSCDQKKSPASQSVPPVNVPNPALFEMIVRVLRGSSLRGRLRMFCEILIDIFRHDELSKHHLPVPGESADEFVEAFLCRAR